MLRLTVLTLLISIPLICNGRESEDERRHKQAELDFVCEEARHEALAPWKLEVYKECINKLKKDKEYCLQQGDNYNGERVNLPPRFYELPECVAAFKYRRSKR